MEIYFDATIRSGAGNSVQVSAKSVSSGESTSSQDSVSITFAESLPPNKPDTPEGPESGEVDTEYTYTFNATDPEDDDISYKIDWGDSVTDWLGPFNSGEKITRSHSWDSEGTYSIRVRAKDINGVMSEEWSDTLEVEISKENKAPTLEIINPIPRSIYLHNKRIPRFLSQKILVIGEINITVTAEDEDGIDRVELVIDDDDSSSIEMEEGSDDTYYSIFDERCFGIKKIKVTAYDTEEKSTEESINIFVINFGLK